METTGTVTVSVLWPEGIREEPAQAMPDFFPDLNLDQVVAGVAALRKGVDLRPFFWTPLHDEDAVRFRQEVARDLEDAGLRAAVEGFVAHMESVERTLNFAGELDVTPYAQGWFLEAALEYRAAVESLARYLKRAELGSRGLRALRAYLAEYADSPRFRALATEATKVREALSRVRYCLLIEPGRFKVKRYEGEEDYGAEIEETFARFKQRDDTKDFLVRFPERTVISHVDAWIIEAVAKLYPEPFAALDKFHTHHQGFPDATLQRFATEVQFYLAYLDFIAPLREAGYPFCYPEVTSTDKAIRVRDGFDLALAQTLHKSGRRVVPNDFYLRGPERVIVVTGPNQGGKTTFARMFGQLHYLASLGLPVPGREARLFLPERIFTHFEREEKVTSHRGRLEDDLLRIRAALERATTRSLFVLNEIFSSTTFRDALALSREIMARILELDAVGVWVTFLDELAAYDRRVVSMVASVDPRDPTVRTFKIVRRPADGLAYAMALARKHGLAPEQLEERIGL